MVIKGFNNFIKYLDSHEIPSIVFARSNSSLSIKVLSFIKEKLGISPVSLTIEKDVNELANRLTTSSLFFNNTLYFIKGFETIGKTERKKLYNNLLKPVKGRFVVISLSEDFEIKEIPEWAVIVEDFTDINKIVKEKEKEYNIKLSPEVKELITELVGNSKFMMDKIFEKLSLLNKDYIEEEKEVIDVIGDSGRRELYELTNSVIEGELENSLKILHNLKNWGIDDYTLIGMIRSLWLRVFLIYILKEDGYTTEDIARAIKRKSWYVKRIMRYLTKEKVIEGMRVIYETERMIRFSIKREYLLENLIEKLSTR